MSDATSPGEVSPFFEAALKKLRNRFPSINDFKLFDQDSFTVDVKNVVLNEQLAKGSYGIVYAGTYNGKQVAVKIEHAGVCVEEQVNVLTELTVLQSVAHDNLVKFMGAGKTLKSAAEAKVMILLEVCQNGALRERLFDTELSWSLLARLALDVALGLQYLHERHLVHRDIKTTNVLISGEWRAKICDFSFGVLEPCAARADFVFGTTEFIAPEVALGEEYGVSADIFSFGIVLCEMICKCEPSADFLHRQAKDFFALDVVELRGAVPRDCPESLEALALQCCQTDAASRPSAPDCVEWLQALVEELDGDEAIDRNLPDQLADISVPVGLMAAQREGGVQFPHSRVSRAAPSARRSSGGARHLDVEAGAGAGAGVGAEEVPGAVVAMFRELSGRVSFLEVQAQELRTENRSLAKELTAIQHDYLDRHQQAEQQRAVAALQSSPSSPSSHDHIEQLPRTYQSRILHPGSPVPVSPASRRSLHSSNLNKLVVAAAVSRAEQDAPALAEKVSCLENIVRSLTTEVRQLKLTNGTATPEDEECLALQTPECVKYDTMRDELPPPLEGGGSEPECLGTAAQEQQEQEQVQHGPVGGPLDVVMQSFLQVVDRCSLSAQHSRSVLSTIEQQSSPARPASRSSGASSSPAGEKAPAQKQGSFLSLAFASPLSPKANKVDPSTQSSPHHKRSSRQKPASESRGGCHTPAGQLAGEGGVWRDIPSHTQPGSARSGGRARAGCDGGARVDLSADMWAQQGEPEERQQLQVAPDGPLRPRSPATHPRQQRPPPPPPRGGEGSPNRSLSPDTRLRRQSSGGGGWPGGRAGRAPEEPQPSAFFQPDHLYHYVFGRESNPGAGQQNGVPAAPSPPSASTTGLQSQRRHTSVVTAAEIAQLGGSAALRRSNSNSNSSAGVSALIGGGGGGAARRSAPAPPPASSLASVLTRSGTSHTH